MTEQGLEELKSEPINNDAGENTEMSVDDTLKQRGNRYGSFKNHANLSVALRTAIFQHYSSTHVEGPALTPIQIEAITMICHKLARISNGDASYDDSWKDIAGYAELVAKELQGIEI